MKYIIDVPNGTKWIEAYYAVDHFQYQGKSIIVDSLTPYTEPDRKAIEDEVWELADYMCRMGVYEKEKCFGFSSTTEVTTNLTYQEAKSLFEKWMENENEIHVGDEVIPTDTQYDTMIVTRIWMDDHSRDCLDTLGLDGCICSFLTSNVKKTGRHFDEVVELLEKMREEEE